MATTQNYYKVKHGLEVPSQETFQVTDNTGPSIRPSLNLDFAKTKTLDPRITFTRASTATYYDGKTTAKAEENLYHPSSGVTPWLSTARLTKTSDTEIAPDGTATAVLLVQQAGQTSGGYVGNTVFPFQTASHVISCYAKAGGSNFLRMVANIATTAEAYFDLRNGIIGTNLGFTNLSINYVGNGWYRCQGTYTRTAGPANNLAIFYLVDANGSPIATPGVSSMYFWGPQIEIGSRSTAYTPTTTAPITNYIPVLQTAATNTARFDHDPITGESKGLLIEEQRTNLALYSDNLSNPYWTTDNQGTLFENVGVAPNGTLTAARLKESTLNSTHARFIKTLPWSSLVNTTFTFSLYVKAYGQKRNIFMLCQDSANAFYAHFDIVAGTVVQSSGSGTGTLTAARIESLGNGWFRISITGTINSSAIYSMIHLDAVGQTGFGSGAYQGDGYSGAYIWGPQIEAGSFPTSYIPTTLTYIGRGSTGTYLAADGLIRTAEANVARYNANESGGGNLLLESAASNFYKATSNFIDDYWTEFELNVTPNSTLSPDGSLVAAKISETTANSLHRITASNIPAGTVTVTVYAKAGERSRLEILSPPTDMGYDLVNGTVVDVGYGTTGAKMESVGGGWFRCSLTYTTGATHGNGFGILNNSNARSYTGDGVSGLYIWGTQVETGSTATSYIPSIETFTGRASTATYYDSTGIVRTAASGQPRYTYNPSLLTAPPKLLLENQATNLLTYSQQFDNAAWNKTAATITANATTAPDGTLTGAKLVANSATADTEKFTNRSIYAFVGQTVTGSVYLKKAQYTWAQVNLFNTTSIPNRVWVNLDNGTIGTNLSSIPVTITSVGNGWYRVTMTASIQSTGAAFITVALADADADLYTNIGDQSSGTFLWGAQLETGYGASSYIVTAGSTVTRAADTSTSVAQTRAADIYSSAAVTRSIDSAKLSGANFSSWYRQNEGTFYAEAYTDRPYGNNSTPGRANTIHVTNDAETSTIHMGPNSVGGTNTNRMYINPGIGNQGDVSISSTSATYKIAGSFIANSLNYATNGVLGTEDTSVNISQDLTALTIGSRLSGTQAQCGAIKKVAYYPKRLTPAELINLTSI